MDDNRSWCAWLELLVLICHEQFFTANNLGWQSTTSRYFQPLAPHTAVLVAGAVHSRMSKFTSLKKAMVIFSQDEYQGTLCLSPVINDLVEANILSNLTVVVGCLITPLGHNYASLGTPQFPSELLSFDWCSFIVFRSWFLIFPRSSGLIATS